MPFTLCGRDRLPCVLRAPFCVRAKHLVRELFLLVEHRIVQVLKSRNELLQVPVSVADDMSGFGSRRSVRFLEGLQARGSGCDPRYGWRGVSKGWSVIERGD